MTRKILVAGYGSLINPDSRARSVRTGAAYPVRVQGFRRAWNFPAAAMTALGVVPDATASLNAALVEVADEAALASLDLREEGYRRQSLPPGSVQPIGGGTIPPGTIELYIPIDPHPPSESCPLVQSYIDVVLSGCLREYGPAFAEEFCLTTSGWEGPWCNDRAAPRYVRAAPVPLAREIDLLLERRVARAFANRR
jgi:hypothetical protein